ncbi:MAG: hypothetical protein KUF75_02000 [Candidatus Thiodiazotropha sp. (ex Ctena orbiculata)]|nr:hypothetical protein [Candidatus Thiodiazotropha sp. (ex Codakia orbicularis)]MBV2123903.1 hypothetical protein [Candidatus Thiodiazotropha taylori]
MKPINVRFARFEGNGTQSPVFKDSEGNEYYWPENDSVDMKVAARHFWDELGYNEKLRYKITFKESNNKKLIEGIYGLK